MFLQYFIFLLSSQKKKKKKIPHNTTPLNIFKGNTHYGNVCHMPTSHMPTKRYQHEQNSMINQPPQKLTKTFPPTRNKRKKSRKFKECEQSEEWQKRTCCAILTMFRNEMKSSLIFFKTIIVFPRPCCLNYLMF